jgi:hypothetical protein
MRFMFAVAISDPTRNVVGFNYTDAPMQEYIRLGLHRCTTIDLLKISVSWESLSKF